jgi:hypothetical protein
VEIGHRPAAVGDVGELQREGLGDCARRRGEEVVRRERRKVTVVVEELKDDLCESVVPHRLNGPLRVVTFEGLLKPSAGAAVVGRLGDVVPAFLTAALARQDKIAGKDPVSASSLTTESAASTFSLNNCSWKCFSVK